MQLFMQITISIALGIAGIAILLLSLRWLRSGGVNTRLVQYVEVPLQVGSNRGNVARVQPRLITGSFLSRTVMPAIRAIGGFFGRITPSGAIESISRKLMIAGNPMGLGAREYYGISMATTLLGVYLAFVVIRRGTATINVVLSILVVILFYYAESLASKPGDQQTKSSKARFTRCTGYVKCMRHCRSGI